MTKTEVGTPQGSVISPLLANVYLHYVFDLWVQHWRKHRATGEVIVVRYADDSVLGFQFRADAERFLKEWKERMRKFELELHPELYRCVYQALDLQRTLDRSALPGSWGDYGSLKSRKIETV